MSLHTRREQADHAAIEAGLGGARLRRHLGLLRERTAPHRVSLTLGTGLLAGVLTSVLPLRGVLRAGTLAFEASLLLARMLPERSPSALLRDRAAFPGEATTHR